MDDTIPGNLVATVPGLTADLINFDFFVSNNGAEVQIPGGGELGLFNFELTVAADAGLGTFDVLIPETNTPGGAVPINVNAPDGVPFSINNGSIRVVSAVPEPGSFVLLVGLAAAGLSTRRRRS